jgi:hypothetical protein
MIYIPSLLYSLPTMTISEKKTNDIQKQASTKFLQCNGIAKSFPRAVVYGPSSFGGMGLHDLYSDSNCIKIDCIINNYKTESDISRVMTIVLAWLQLTTGTSIPILESTYQLEYIPMNWFLSVKEFINKIGVTIHIPNLWTPKILRTHDIILMDVVDGLEISNTKKRIFNNFRFILPSQLFIRNDQQFRITHRIKILNKIWTRHILPYLHLTLAKSTRS